MFAEGYPFEKVEMDALVWSVGKGKREDTEQLNCSDVIRVSSVAVIALMRR